MSDFVTPSSINRTTILQQRDLLLQAIEELRFARSTIRSLEHQLSDLQLNKSKLESELSNYKIEKEKLYSECCTLRETVSYFQKEIKEKSDDDDENKKLKIALETSEMALSCVKNNVTSYKSTVHALEKKLAECEQKLSVTLLSSTSVNCKIEQFNLIVKKINKRLEQVTSTQLRLEQSIKVVSSINAEYSCLFKNAQHELCELKNEKANLLKQIADIRKEVEMNDLNIDIESKTRCLQNKIKQLEDKNLSLVESNVLLESELKDSKQQLCKATTSLKILQEMMKQASNQVEFVSVVEQTYSVKEDNQRNVDESLSNKQIAE